MTIELVFKTHRDVFYRALLEGDWNALATLYADEYMLVRSDGSVLTKGEVLADLRTQQLSFESIEVSDEKLRIADSVAVLTGQSRTRSRHAGTLVQSCFRFIALYQEAPGGLKLLHFQSTSL